MLERNIFGNARGVMVTVVGIGRSEPSSNPGRGSFDFPWHYYPWEKYESNYSPSSYE